MVVLSDMQPRTHTTNLETFSFEGRCPACVPAHPWGTPLRLERKVRGHRLDSQLTPLQEGTVHHLYQKRRIAGLQHVHDGLSQPLAKPPPGF